MSQKKYNTFRKQLRETANYTHEFNDNDVQYVVHALGLNPEKIDLDQLKRGMNVEREHADLTNLDPVMTARIALAHIKEYDKYYDELEKMEKKFEKKKK